MAAWVCGECTTVYSVGAPRCPHCGATTYTEDGMPKTGINGPTYDGDAPGEDGAPSAGISFSTSSPSGGSSSTTTPSGPPKRARTTGNPSGTPHPPTADPESSSTALSTDGNTPGTGDSQKSSDGDVAGSFTLNIPKPGVGNGE